MVLEWFSLAIAPLVSRATELPEDLLAVKTKCTLRITKCGGVGFFVLLMIHPMMMAMMYTQLGLKKRAEMLPPMPSNIPVALCVLWALIILPVITLYIKLLYGLWLKTSCWVCEFFVGGTHALVVRNQPFMIGLSGVYLDSGRLGAGLDISDTVGRWLVRRKETWFAARFSRHPETSK
ncbi:hypothetical protein IPG36_03375 [bacterium]|nr:MAG: hypothetical protein IPG36_03375 [bacterium]